MNIAKIEAVWKTVDLERHTESSGCLDEPRHADARRFAAQQKSTRGMPDDVDHRRLDRPQHPFGHLNVVLIER